MEFDEYRNHVLKTESVLPQDHQFTKDAVINLLKTIDKLADVLDLMKKGIFYKQEISAHQISTLLYEAHKNLDALHQGHVYGDFKKDTTEIDFRLLHSIIGMVGESGEIAKLGVKVLEANEVTKEDEVNFLEECGDHSWYKTVGYDHLGITEAQERIANVRKLQKRYGDSFSVEKCMNRDREAEYQALSAGEDEHGNDSLKQD